MAGRPGNREALVETVQLLQGAVLKSGVATVVLILLSGALGGFSQMASSRSPGWGSLYFLLGAGRTLLYAVPAGVLLYVGVTLLAGLIVFIWMRYRNAPGA